MLKSDKQLHKLLNEMENYYENDKQSTIYKGFPADFPGNFFMETWE